MRKIINPQFLFIMIALTMASVTVNADSPPRTLQQRTQIVELYGHEASEVNFPGNASLVPGLVTELNSELIRNILQYKNIALISVDADQFDDFKIRASELLSNRGLAYLQMSGIKDGKAVSALLIILPTDAVLREGHERYLRILVKKMQASLIISQRPGIFAYMSLVGATFHLGLSFRTYDKAPQEDHWVVNLISNEPDAAQAAEDSRFVFSLYEDKEFGSFSSFDDDALPELQKLNKIKFDSYECVSVLRVDAVKLQMESEAAAIKVENDKKRILFVTRGINFLDKITDFLKVRYENLAIVSTDRNIELTKEEMPGAAWHIVRPTFVDKNRYGIEGAMLEGRAVVAFDLHKEGKFVAGNLAKKYGYKIVVIRHQTIEELQQEICHMPFLERHVSDIIKQGDFEAAELLIPTIPTSEATAFSSPPLVLGENAMMVPQIHLDNFDEEMARLFPEQKK